MDFFLNPQIMNARKVKIYSIAMAHEHFTNNTNVFLNFSLNLTQFYPSFRDRMKIIIIQTLSVNNAPIIISCNEYFIIQCCGRTHLNMFQEKDEVELKRKASER